MPSDEIKQARKMNRERSVRQGCSKNTAIHGAMANSRI